MTATSFDTLFNQVAAEQGVSALYKGHARSALRYANFDLTNIDNTELAKKIICTAVTKAAEADEGEKEKTASTFMVPMSLNKEDHDAQCPRCKSATPMQNIELLNNVKARYCAQCRLTDIA